MAGLDLARPRHPAGFATGTATRSAAQATPTPLRAPPARALLSRSSFWVAGSSPAMTRRDGGEIIRANRGGIFSRRDKVGVERVLQQLDMLRGIARCGGERRGRAEGGGSGTGTVWQIG